MSKKLIVCFSLFVALADAAQAQVQPAQTPKPAAPKAPQHRRRADLRCRRVRFRHPEARAEDGPGLIRPIATSSARRTRCRSRSSARPSATGADTDGSIAPVSPAAAAGFRLRICNEDTLARTVTAESAGADRRGPYESQRYVTGNVRAPGKVPMNGPTITLIEALASPPPSADASTRHGEASADPRGSSANGEGLELGRAATTSLPRTATSQRSRGAALRHPAWSEHRVQVPDPGMTIEQAIALAAA
jgi:hypothetical protein